MLAIVMRLQRRFRASIPPSASGRQEAAVCPCLYIIKATTKFPSARILLSKDTREHQLAATNLVVLRAHQAILVFSTYSQVKQTREHQLAANHLVVLGGDF